MDTTFGYRAIVFALQKGKTLDNSLEVKKLLKYRSVIISEHPKNNDEDCEWNELHYHGIVEHPQTSRFDADRTFLDLKNKYCKFFKSETCRVPVHFLGYMQLPPKQIVFINELPGSDLTMLQVQVTPEVIETVALNRKKRFDNKRESSSDIMYLKDLILESKAQSETELITDYHNDKIFENIFCKRTFSTNFKKAMSFANIVVLHKDYLDLAAEYIDRKNECMTPHESAELMLRWCEYQNIKPSKFAENILEVMDHKKRKQNTLIFQGLPNSGKTFIANSISKACIFYGAVSQGTAGYAFMWQDCINKRVIIINEPFFDLCMIESLKTVLEGTGTFVHKKNTGDEYLCPTPVIITTNNDVWCQAPSAKDAIITRTHTWYNNLKPCPFLKDVTKDLHPRWISTLLLHDRKTNVIDYMECHTSPGTGTADQEPTLKKQTPREAQSTLSTRSADNTILKSKLLAPKKQIDDSKNDYTQKDRGQETSSPDLSAPKEVLGESPDLNTYQESTPLYQTPKRQVNKRPRSLTISPISPTPSDPLREEKECPSPRHKDQSKEYLTWENEPQTPPRKRKEKHQNEK